MRLLNVPLTHKPLDIRSESVAEARRLSDEILRSWPARLPIRTRPLRDYLTSRDSRALADGASGVTVHPDRQQRQAVSDTGWF